MKKFLFLAAVAMCLASCSPFVLKSSDVLNGSDLTSYKSFQLQKIEKDKLPEAIMEPDVERLYYVIAQELVARGYTQVQSGGDLTVYVGMTTKESIETDVDPGFVNVGVGVGVGGAPYGPRPGWGGYNYFGATPYVHAYYGADPTITTEVVENGVLMVDLVDNSDNNHVFCTQISAKITGDQLILKDNEKLTKAAEVLFKKFPLPKTK